MSAFFPNGLSWRTLQVWRRNWDVHLRTWKISFLPPVLEPVLYLLAFGTGMGALVGRVHYQGEELSYIGFLAPGLISVTIMFHSFYENTYTSFVRMYYQRIFDALLATPLMVEEILLGEMLWGASLALMAATLMTSVVALFGLLHWPSALLILPLAFLGGSAFATAAMCFTGIVPSISAFNLPVFLFITPMFLFSGTFFPLATLPHWAQLLAAAFPLTHLVTLVRAAALGRLALPLLWNLLYLVLFTTAGFPLAILLMRRRLIA